MNVQQKIDASNAAQRALDEAFEDNASHQRNKLAPRQEVTPPTYGGPQRDAINSVVDGIIGDICGRIGDLRKTLDDIEHQVLQSAAKSKHALNEHVSVCVRINDEIRHMQEVVADLKAESHEP